MQKMALGSNLLLMNQRTGSRAEHVQKAELVASLCKEYDLNFSPRLQLIIWDKALKV